MRTGGTMNNTQHSWSNTCPQRQQSNNDDFPAFVNPADEGGCGVSYLQPRLPTQAACEALRGNPLWTVMLFRNWGRDCRLHSLDEQGSERVILVLNAGPELYPADEYLSKGKHENTCAAHHFPWVTAAQKLFIFRVAAGAAYNFHKLNWFFFFFFLTGHFYTCMFCILVNVACLNCILSFQTKEHSLFICCQFSVCGIKQKYTSEQN